MTSAEYTSGARSYYLNTRLALHDAMFQVEGYPLFSQFNITLMERGSMYHQSAV